MAAAVPQPTDTPPTSPAAPNATNDSAPTPTINGTGPGGPGGWGVGPFKSTEEWAADFAAGLANFTVDEASNGTATIVDMFSAEMLTLPAPGQLDAPLTWLYPQNGMWPATMTLYRALYALVAIPMLAGGAWYVFAADAHNRRSEARRFGKNLALLLGGLIIVPLALHAGNIIAMGFAPSGDEFLSTPGNIGRLGVGIIVGGGLLLLKAALVILAVVVLYVQDLLVYLSVATYPAAIWLLSTRSTFAQALGAGIIGMLSFLIFLKALQAVALRFLFELPLGFSDAEAIATSAEALAVTIIGVALIFILVPIYGTKKAVPASVVAIGGQVRSGGQDWIDDHREDLPDREQLVEGVRGLSPMHSRRAEPAGGVGGAGGDATATATATAEPATRRVGSLQQRTASHARPGGRPGAATRSPSEASQRERADRLGSHRAAEGASASSNDRAAADDD